MKREDLTRMYGATPESFAHRVAFALQKTEEQPMKRKQTLRTVLITAAILVLLMAVAYAAFSSQVAAIFGRSYGDDMQSWLEYGNVATVNQSFTMDGVTFTLDEVVYRSHGLYGVGTIAAEENSGVILIAEDHSPDGDAYGYDVHGAGGEPEDAPADAPTYAQVASETGRKLLMARTIPEKIGVDGGTLLSPHSLGYSLIPQRDGSIRFTFEASDGYAVEEGEVYTIEMKVSMFELSPSGEMLEDTRRIEKWTVEMKPTPIAEMK